MVLENFRRFTETGRSFKPKISIRTNGQIGFNAGAVKRFGIDKYEFVVAYFNENQKKIAIEFTNDSETDGAIKIVKRSNNFFFSGKSFLEFHEIDYRKTIAYEVEWMKEERIAIIDLGDCEADPLEE